MSIEQKRVEPGVPTAGQWTAVTKPEGSALPVPPAVTFDAAFDAARGTELAAELSRMKKISASERIAASRFADPLREGYEEYFGEPGHARGVRNTQDEFLAQMPSLDPERARHHLELVGFAVNNEMKALNAAAVLSPDYGWETLIDPGNYRNEDELEYQGAEDNHEKWEEAVDTAVFVAMSEEAAAAAAERSHLAA